MKTLTFAGPIFLRRFSAILLLSALSVTPALAQFAPRGGFAPQLGGTLAKLFGDAAFTATMEVQAKDPQGNPISFPGKITFADAKSRFEMDITKMQAGMLPAEAAAQMKAMGMDNIVMISRPDKSTAFLVYPGVKAYVEMPLDAEGAAPSDIKMETTELGKETVDGQPAVKNRVVLTEKSGKKHTATVWNATKLNNFPIKIEHTESGQAVTVRFKEIKFGKPEARNFDPPADFKRHEDMMTLLQEIIMKQMGGGQGLQQQQ
jgi:hypothetical protein